MSRPWMPLYVGDYLGDTRRLSTLEHGAYLLLLMDYWQNGSLPTDDSSLAHIAGLGDKEWQRAKIKIEALFQKGWKHKRVEAELFKAAEKSKNARASAEASWNSPKRADRASERNADASANAQRTDREGLCEPDAHARVPLPQSHSKLNNNPPSSTISEESGFDEFWGLFPKGQASRPKAAEAWAGLTLAERAHAIAAIPSLKQAKPTTHPISPERWLREKRFLSHAQCRSGLALVRVERLSAAGVAWEAYMVAKNGKGPPWSNGAWHFPTEYPPILKEMAQ